ncbi:MAG: hypothetical protein O2960_30550 [Verrucomicrobia bacterium]|nr:hypothetical protein [Verrucomicrobiota bacterium]
MEPTKNILQLRELLAERFPGLRSVSEKRPGRNLAFRGSESSPGDDLLAGRLAKGEITELVSARLSSGAALVVTTLLRKACENHQWIGLIDGRDSFDPTAFDNAALSRILWLRCSNADQAMAAADLLLRDGNMPLVLLDLAMNPVRELRKVTASHWYRLQRIIERTSAALLVVTPCAMVSSAQTRLSLNSRFALGDLGRLAAELSAQLNIKLVHRRVGEVLDAESALQVHST